APIVIAVLGSLFLLAGWCYGFYIFRVRRKQLEEATKKAMQEGVGCGNIFTAIPWPVAVFLTPFVCALVPLFLFSYLEGLGRKNRKQLDQSRRRKKGYNESAGP